MERVVRGRAFTLTKSFSTDGVAATVTGTPTVTIVRQSDGTTVTSSAVTGAGVGPFQTTVTAANNQLLDTLTVTWTATISGQTGTYVDTVEVAGEMLFSIPEVRALAPLSNATTYTTAMIEDARTLVEQAIEDACGVAFVPRYTQETVQGSPAQTDLLLSWSRVRTVRSVVIDGVTVNPLSNVQIRPDGRLNLYLGWTAYTVFPYINAVTVGYEHGYTNPPERVKRAAMLLARVWLVTGPIDDRASTFTSTDGGTYSLVTPGRGGSLFGVPEVDAIVQEYSLQGSCF